MIFSAEDSQKASSLMQKQIDECGRCIDRLKDFMDDNAKIINLILKISLETRHSIMVPFGEATFFPGELVHPAEHTVHLGAGYYVKRSAVQTVGILERRSEFLMNRIKSFKAVKKDLETAASFFSDMAQESANGLVEITEMEDSDAEEALEGNESSLINKYASISSRIPEILYKKERKLKHQKMMVAHAKDREKTALHEDEKYVNILGTKKSALDEDEEYVRIFSRMVALEKEEEEFEKAALEKKEEEEEFEKAPPEKEKIAFGKIRRRRKEHGNKYVSTNQEVRNALDAQVISKENASKDLELPQEEKKIGVLLPTSNTAFTGLIIEHTRNTGMNMVEGGRSSKPVSRFKMQKK